MKNDIKIKILSSLEKVFPTDEPPVFENIKRDSVFLNEIYSFQIAYISEGEKQNFFLEIKSEKCSSMLYAVGLVPSELPAYPQRDEGYIKTAPGLFPDVLFPIEEKETLFAQPEVWRSVWIDCIPEKDGISSITVRLIDPDGRLILQCEKEFEIIPYKLPEQELMHTEWFHCDCISNYYNVPIMSEDHWKLIENYISFAADNGINTILTPVFTPPLDTNVGGERPTMQLVDITYVNDGYTFGFDNLKRWIDMCEECGIKYFEMSHLFTQWGAKHAPKIVAHKNKKLQKIFGWETDASSKEYGEFLDAFLPALVRKLNEWGVAERCLFHVSDEPFREDIEFYRLAKERISRHLSGFKIIDALSDMIFFNEGLVENPVCATNHIQPFLETGSHNLWAYYCCAQNIKVSNRFMAMPSARNRIIGIQLYKYSISGFLHWGYNFWNTQYSVKSINPYQVTDAGCAFPSGDAFLVYPGKEGPIPSIRLKVFKQALYDLRALKLLETLSSKDFVTGILEKDLEVPITFDEFPEGAEYIQDIRRRINEEIKKRLA